MSRPTELHFRSPHERTPDYYEIKVRNNGTHLLNGLQINEKKTSFNSSLPRFSQYENWARNTSVFLGPGVYQDTQSFNLLNKQPTSIVYKLSHLGKNQGKKCFTMVNNHTMVYEPGFENFQDKKENQMITKNDQARLSVKNIFNNDNIQLMRSTRNNKNVFLQKSFNRLSVKRNSQSFYSDGREAFKDRASTSYSGTRPIGSTHSHTRNVNTSGHNSQINNSSYLQPLQIDSIRNPTINTMHDPTGDMKNRSFSNLNGPLTQSQPNSSVIAQQFGNRPSTTANVDPLINPDHLVNFNRVQTTSHTKRARSELANHKNFTRNPRMFTDFQKSVSLLRAYGEYERFIEMSKKFMKEKGIIIKKKLRRPKKSRLSSMVDEPNAGGMANLMHQSTQPNSSQDRVLGDGVNNDSVEQQYRDIDQILEKKLEQNKDGLLIEQNL